MKIIVLRNSKTGKLKYAQFNTAKDYKPKSYPGYIKVGPTFESTGEAKEYFAAEIHKYPTIYNNLPGLLT